MFDGMGLKMSKGQAAIEMLVILAVSISVLLVLLSYGNDKLAASTSRFNDAQIVSSLKELVKGADFVYSQSIGTTTEVKISIPRAVKGINIVSNHCFEYVVSVPDGTENRRLECSLAKVNGTISKDRGSEIILTNQGEYVLVSQR